MGENSQKWDLQQEDLSLINHTEITLIKILHSEQFIYAIISGLKQWITLLLFIHNTKNCRVSN